MQIPPKPRRRPIGLARTSAFKPPWIMTNVAVGRIIELDRPVDLRYTIGPLRRGPRDPCLRVRHGEILRATRTPVGPASLRLRQTDMIIEASAWGEGASWALESASGLIGLLDDDSAFSELLADPSTPGRMLLRDLRTRLPGMRLTRTGQVTETLIPIILEQKVASVEAHHSYRELTLAVSEPAPGPPALVDGLLLPPAPQQLTHLPSWIFHRCGIEEKRARILRAIASYSNRLDALIETPPGGAQRIMMAIPGIGAWTAAETALAALGDPDAVSVGDFHLPHTVAFAFTGAHRGDDELMLQLLEPYTGQRGRVIRLIEAAGVSAPRHGPRVPNRSIRSI